MVAQSVQTTKDKTRAQVETARFWLAIRLPYFSQKTGFSGSQLARISLREGFSPKAAKSLFEVDIWLSLILYCIFLVLYMFLHVPVMAGTCVTSEVNMNQYYE